MHQSAAGASGWPTRKMKYPAALLPVLLPMARAGFPSYKAAPTHWAGAAGCAGWYAVSLATRIRCRALFRRAVPAPAAAGGGGGQLHSAGVAAAAAVPAPAAGAGVTTHRPAPGCSPLYSAVARGLCWHRA